MAMNYAEAWSPELLPIYTQQSLCSPFIASNVKWLGRKTFHFTQMSVTGFKDHARAKGYNAGTITQNNNEYAVSHDRDVEFFIDRADVDETNESASLFNVARVFAITQAVPEMDALFFSKVATSALATTGLHSSTAVADYATTPLAKIKAKIKAVKRYRQSLIVYVSSDVMDKLELSSELTRKIEMTQIADGGVGIETRVTYIDGCPIIEVIDDERFYDKFNFDSANGGFTPVVRTYKDSPDVALVSGKAYYTRSGNAGAYVYTLVAAPDVANIATYYEVDVVGSKKINVLIATPETTIAVPKIDTIYTFAPGAHTEGDGWLYQQRSLSDVFTFPNGKTNTIDSVYVDVDTADVTA